MIIEKKCLKYTVLHKETTQVIVFFRSFSPESAIDAINKPERSKKGLKNSKTFNFLQEPFATTNCNLISSVAN